MNILDLLKGRTIIISTEVGVDVELEIKEVKENQHSEDLEPSTRENDWWPKTREWTTYTVYFTNGHSKNFSSIHEMKIKGSE